MLLVEAMKSHAGWARWLVTGMAVCFCGTDARATVLTFDQIRLSGVVVPTISGNAVPQDYGDRVSGSPQPVAGGQFTYGEGGEGFTPNIVVDYSVAGLPSGGVSLWEENYGGLTNALFGNQNSLALQVQFTADDGFDAQLHEFDLAGWPNADYTINAVRVLAGSAVVFSASDVLVEGDFNGPRRTSFDFPLPLSGSRLLIEIDYSNLPAGQQDNIGIDNIRFSQNPPATEAPIPEPSTFLLLGAASLGVVALKRRSH
jgi:hypothetical protein